MSKTRYLNPADMVNKYQFMVLAPSRVAPISAYDLEFGYRPSYEPTSLNQIQRTGATVNEMIEWVFQGIQFRFINDLDMLEVQEILANYFNLMERYDLQQFSPADKLYFEKALQFQEIITQQIEKLEHYHTRKNPTKRKRSLLDMLKSVTQSSGVRR